ncbi:MAG: enoyl-CoA hydratase/isomerase family protein [Hyphomicrobiales bacterium]
MIEQSENGNVTILTLAHGKANTLDIEFCEALVARFEQLRTSPARAVVLTGRAKIFSAGVDLVRLAGDGTDYIRKFLPALHRLYDAVYFFPKPVVAAVNGHAIAGGCVLACCADMRVMARVSGRIGVTELLVGVPFPVLAFEIMRAVTTPRFFPQAILSGATQPPDAAIERGFIDEIAEPAALMQRALELAQTLAALSPPAFAMAKRQIRQPVSERLLLSQAIEEEVTEIWTRPETLARIRDYVARTFKKS